MAHFESSFNARTIPTKADLAPIVQEVGDRLAESFADPIAWNAYALLYNFLSDLKEQLPEVGQPQLPE